MFYIIKLFLLVALILSASCGNDGNDSGKKGANSSGNSGGGKSAGNNPEAVTEEKVKGLSSELSDFNQKVGAATNKINVPLSKIELVERYKNEKGGKPLNRELQRLEMLKAIADFEKVEEFDLSKFQDLQDKFEIVDQNIKSGTQTAQNYFDNLTQDQFKQAKKEFDRLSKAQQTVADAKAYLATSDDEKLNEIFAAAAKKKAQPSPDDYQGKTVDEIKALVEKRVENARESKEAEVKANDYLRKTLSSGATASPDLTTFDEVLGKLEALLLEVNIAKKPEDFQQIYNNFKQIGLSIVKIMSSMQKDEDMRNLNTKDEIISLVKNVNSAINDNNKGALSESLKFLIKAIEPTNSILIKRIQEGENYKRAVERLTESQRNLQSFNGIANKIADAKDKDALIKAAKELEPFEEKAAEATEASSAEIPEEAFQIAFSGHIYKLAELLKDNAWKKEKEYISVIVDDFIKRTQMKEFKNAVDESKFEKLLNAIANLGVEAQQDKALAADMVKLINAIESLSKNKASLATLKARFAK